MRVQALCSIWTVPTFPTSSLPPSSGYSEINKQNMRAARYFEKSVSLPKTTRCHNTEDYYKNTYDTKILPSTLQKSVQVGALFINICKLHVILCKQQEINIQIYEGSCLGLSRPTVSFFEPVSLQLVGSTANVYLSHQYTKFSQRSVVFPASGLSTNVMFSASITLAILMWQAGEFLKKERISNNEKFLQICKVTFL